MSLTVTAGELSDLMDFDHVIRVNSDGTVSEVSDIWAPEVNDGEVSDGDWELMTGYTGQYGYRGPIMHSSEFIGGDLAHDILVTPGLYVAVVAYSSDDDNSDDGWAVATIPATVAYVDELLPGTLCEFEEFIFTVATVTEDESHEDYVLVTPFVGVPMLLERSRKVVVLDS